MSLVEQNAMTAVEAIKKVSEEHNITSKYRLAKELSDEKLTVQPIQISNYVHPDPKKRRKMSKAVADRFFEVYGIYITDQHDPGTLRKELEERL